jgi:hypothetical protein
MKTHSSKSHYFYQRRVLLILKVNFSLARKLALLKKKNSEVNIPIPRVYFFFAGAFFTSFLTGFFAIKTTSGFKV